MASQAEKFADLMNSYSSFGEEENLHNLVVRCKATMKSRRIPIEDAVDIQMDLLMFDLADQFREIDHHTIKKQVKQIGILCKEILAKC